MLVTHINAIETSLLKMSEISANAGHTIHKGTPREAFIRGFLENHVGESIGIGTGEIIDCNSKPMEKRNQIDIVLYKESYPKLSFGGGIDAFLAESVISTIEVKSILTKTNLGKSFDSIRNVKKAQRNAIHPSINMGYQPPGILSFIVAFKGPSHMKTVYDWIAGYTTKNNVIFPNMPPLGDARLSYACPLADLIVILGKGIIAFDNSPVTIIKDDIRKEHADCKWAIYSQPSKNLLCLFLYLIAAISGVTIQGADLNPYIKGRANTECVFVP